MNSARGGNHPIQQNTSSSQHYKSPQVQTALLSQGSISQRGAQQRSDWSKTTSIISSKPFNQNRSIDNKGFAMIQKKIELNTSTNPQSNPLSTQNFMFNTYQTGGQTQKQNKIPQSLSHDTNKHRTNNQQYQGITTSAWINTPTQQQQSYQNSSQSISALRTFTNNSSLQNNSQNRNLQTSNSSQNLKNFEQIMMNAVNNQQIDTSLQNRYSNSNFENISNDQIVNLHQMNQFHQILDQGEQRNKIFSELSNNLETLRAYRINDNKQGQLATVLQNFTPMQRENNSNQKQLVKTSNEKKKSLNGGKLRLSGKVSFDDLKFEKKMNGSQTVSSHTSRINMRATSKSNNQVDVTHNDDDQSNDVNESIIMFKQSTHDTKSLDPTPKSIECNSYNQKSIEQSDFKSTQMGLSQNKDSRNKYQQIFLSQQLSSESSRLITDQKQTFQSELESIQSAQRQDKNKSNKKLKPKAGIKSKMNKTGLTSNLTTLQQINGSKTPQDIFNYKLKAQNSSTTNRIDSLIKGSTQTVITNNTSSIPSSSRQIQGSKKQSVSSVISSSRLQNSNHNSQNQFKPPISNTNAQNKIEFTKTLGKSESYKTIFFTQKNQNNAQIPILNDDELNSDQNCKFIYQTVQNISNQPNSIVPPNSEQLVSPEIQLQKAQTSNMLQQNFNDKIKALDFELDQVRDHKQEIRVVSRFRPYNQLEREFKELYHQKEETIQFLGDGKTLKLNDGYSSSSSNQLFTFDNIFKPNSTQEEVFNILGKETINDIMQGYNGTIFAYGQTGSGKTFTMYGQDMFDEQLMGIIPRSARQIFQHIREQDLEIEYQIRVQMVEIYKEQFRDLLHDTPDQPKELKIKEDPKRGTYVEGLNDVCIVSEEEMMAVLCTGETMRHVASTNLNKLSSRSHSICIIEIIQKFPNDSERRGVLNLVDLAGSERVSKSHAQGQALEEAKKINYSLSALGKVINCLTKGGNQYVPYRDSKLTRLLKESLGGNNKTSLIVACSLHHSNLEETLSTLRFAQSAKFIKNKVRLNIKTSPEQLQTIIEQLKNELRNCKEEIYRLRISASNNFTTQQTQPQLEYPGEEYADAHEFQEHKQQQQPSVELLEQKLQQQILEQQDHDIIKNTVKQLEIKYTIHNRPHQSLLAKNYDVIETNNQKMQMLSLLSSELSIIPGTGTPDFISPIKNYEIKLMQLINHNEDLEMKIRSKDQDIDALKSQKDELQQKNINLEEKLLSYKQKLLIMEKKVAEYESDKDFMKVTEVKQSNKMDDLSNQIQVLTSQINCLERALEDSEHSCQDLLKEKQAIYQKSIKDFLNETIKIKRIKVSDALDNFINKPYVFTSAQIKRSYISQIDLLSDFKNQENLVKQSDQLISSLNEKDLLQRNLYSLETLNALEDTPPELTIYLLKQMLIEASLANHNLQRILAVNRWRQVMEYGKNKIKNMQCKTMESTIETLDEVLERTRKTHDKLRARVDKLENHLYDNRNYYGDIVLQTEGNNANNICIGSSTVKNQILDDNTLKNLNSLKNKTNNLNNHNQSIVSMIMHGSNVNQNSKSRFVRTITNRTLGKVFNFMEKSPISRGSVGANNQSILSQYYGQRQYPNQKPGGTPLRTGGINSPAIYSFQSPIRRQNTFSQNVQKSQNTQIQNAVSQIQQSNLLIYSQDSDSQQIQPKLTRELLEQQDKVLQQHNIVQLHQQYQEPQIINNSNSNTCQVNGDQLTFEDAIVKFFNSSEVESKNTQRVLGLTSETKVGDYGGPCLNLNQDDLLKIENINNLQEIKDYLRSKFERSNLNHLERLQNSASIHLNPLFAQYQHNAAFHNNQNTTNLQSSQVENNPQINSHTTNNNLYAQSNDFYDVQNPSYQKDPACSQSSNQYDNQRQEHVMTLASDYMITSNSVIGPGGLFSGNGQIGGYGGNYHQNDYLDRLQEKIVQLQEEVETQKCRAEEHKKAYYESKKQIEQIRDLMEDKESKHNSILRSEVCQWENALNKFKEMNENELLKKQKEIEKLHEILAQWIENYQQLEHSKGVHNQQIDKLVLETVKHKRQQSNLLSEVMKTPHNNKLSSNFPTLQSFDSRVPQYSQNSKYIRNNTEQTSYQQPILQTYSNLNPDLNQNQMFEKKRINGDNSPVAQEDSCFDFDQSINQQQTIENYEYGLETQPLQTYGSNE